ncbi:AAA family ATPase [Sphingobacterium paludis]|uniref:AAA domain-containing protein n=1 Tax=Sphingobacterium paludis TaxID=1476465 RepID=A0A4R7CX52_9SPHI|nr:AAA family ATPase [Sphingobacterium paludis]TDS12271.1 AAA domain-containing protein [Sphingobacterium paludis]
MSIKTIKEHFHVITGGPGVGKTTLIKSLHDCGFRIVDEDARRIIKNEMQAKGEGLPWKSKQRYAALMLQASIESFLAVVASRESNPTFFDRGLLDAICYMRMEQMPISEEVIELTKKYVYDTDVFMLPP